MIRLFTLLVLIGCCLAASTGQCEPTQAENALGKSFMESVLSQIVEYHQGAPEEYNKIRLVYFHPKDREPLANWEIRMQRIISDVADFYSEELKRFGMVNTELPFDQKKGKYHFHLVRGQKPASDYDYDSGRAIVQELRRKLRHSIDFDREHILILHGLCHQKANGKYVFNAPYYGWGNQKRGVCHAADCELLDPLLLTNTDEKIVYEEHYYPHVNQTLALFNTWYLGGIAHELGHGIGLPHDKGSPEESKRSGYSLMGFGNHHYREDKWGGPAPTFISLATALRLAASPLLTQSNRGRWSDPEVQLNRVKFTSDGDTISIRGQITAAISSYAVIANLWKYKSWPDNPGTDHRTVTHPTKIRNGHFEISKIRVTPGEYQLRLSTLHVNGAERDFSLHLSVNNQGEPDVEALNGEWQVTQATKAVVSGSNHAKALLTEAAILEAPLPIAADKLRVLQEIIDPPSFLDLGNTSLNVVSLSDCKWNQAKVGWGKVARNHYYFDENIRNGVFLMLNDKFYRKGLYAHSPSKYSWDLEGRWNLFTATVGLRDGAHLQGSAVFLILGDGKELFRSSILRRGQQEDVRINISSVDQLELITQGGEGHNHNSWAIWVNPYVKR